MFVDSWTLDAFIFLALIQITLPVIFVFRSRYSKTKGIGEE